MWLQLHDYRQKTHPRDPKIRENSKNVWVYDQGEMILATHNSAQNKLIEEPGLWFIYKKNINFI